MPTPTLAIAPVAACAIARKARTAAIPAAATAVRRLTASTTDRRPCAGYPVKRGLHHTPTHRWTVATLVRAAGVSRAALARRFTNVDGERPIRYLKRTRIDLAAGLPYARDHHRGRPQDAR